MKAVRRKRKEPLAGTTHWKVSQDGKLEQRRPLPSGQSQSVEHLSPNRAFLTTKEIDRRMLAAAESGDLALLEFIIETCGPDLDQPLLQAARAGKAESVGLLLKHGARLEVHDAGGGTPLHWAVSKGHCDVVRQMLRHAPAELRRPSAGGTTLLHHAVLGARAEMVLELLKAGADPNAGEYRGYNALHTAMLVNASGINSIAATLLKFGANPDALTARGETFLVLLATSRIAAIPASLEAAAIRVIDVPESAGRTPLIWACTVGNDTMVHGLLRLGAKLATPAKNGKTARDIAVECGYADIVAILHAAQEQLARTVQPPAPLATFMSMQQHPSETWAASKKSLAMQPPRLEFAATQGAVQVFPDSGMSQGAEPLLREARQ
jgi:ankyrin repeat protein